MFPFSNEGFRKRDADTKIVGNLESQALTGAKDFVQHLDVLLPMVRSRTHKNVENRFIRCRSTRCSSRSERSTVRSRHGAIGRFTSGHLCQFPVSSSNSSGRIYVSPCLPARDLWQALPTSSIKNHCTHLWRSFRRGGIHSRGSYACWTNLNGGNELLYEGYQSVVA